MIPQDRETLQLIALTYRAHRQAGADHPAAVQAALVVFRGLYPEALDDEAERAITHIVAHVSHQNPQAFWRRPSHEERPSR